MCNRKILLATLNWGLGHSTRCIPLIRAILDKNHEVFLASDGAAGTLLREEFPELPFFNLPSYRISYPRSHFWLHWATRLPSMLGAIDREKMVLKEILKETRVDTIISDNRYGMYHHTTQNILLTHQLTLPLNSPLRNPINRLLRNRVNSFDRCWIPDWEGPDNLSGQLSEGELEIPKLFIGPQSRFISKPDSPEIDLLVMISGPEPSRTDFQKKLQESLPRNLNTVVLMGKPGEFIARSVSSRTFNHLPSQDLNHLLNISKVVVSRSGYSSLMDYIILQKKAILIPTPLQPEQTYLANRHGTKPQFRVLSHDLIGFDHAINSLNEEITSPVSPEPVQLPEW